VSVENIYFSCFDNFYALKHRYSASLSQLAILRFCVLSGFLLYEGGSVAEWLACWTQAQKGLGSNRSRDAVG